MQFKLTLAVASLAAMLPVNYQYPLSAAIYRIIAKADFAYGAFLHDVGYGIGRKRFRLFTFSDLRTPFLIYGDRLLLTGTTAELRVCFHIPKAAESFVKGLFLNKKIEIADKKGKAIFTITNIEALSSGLTSELFQEVLLQPLSPIICGQKNERGNYDFLSPEHPDFVPRLLHNWMEKYISVYGPEESETAFADTEMNIIYWKKPPQSRLLTIKAGTPAETKVRGFVNYKLRVKSKRHTLELLQNAGAGVYNAIGFGCVGIIK